MCLEGFLSIDQGSPTNPFLRESRIAVDLRSRRRRWMWKGSIRAENEEKCRTRQVAHGQKWTPEGWRRRGGPKVTYDGEREREMRWASVD